MSRHQRREADEVVPIGRVYDTAPTGRRRILVDRLWPRGLAKSDAHLDRWMKEVAPSTDLRRWYAHDVDRYDEFAQRYREELRSSPAFEELLELCRREDVVLVTATRDLEHSGAGALADHVADRLRGTD